jgi:hypothetical protein
VTWVALLTAGGRLAKALARAERERESAGTREAELEADVRMAQLRAREVALISGPGVILTRSVQTAIAAPFVIYNFKVIVWDKVLKLGVTDPLGAFEQYLGLIVCTFYFLAVGGASVMDRWKR